MPLPKSRTTTAEAIVGLWTIALATFVIAALYFGRELLTPLALAGLLTFLLTPLVNRLQRWLGRVLAVLVVVAMIFGVTVTAGYVLTRQIVDLGMQLPSYKENIRSKLQSIHVPSNGAWTRLSETFDDLKEDIPGAHGLVEKENSESREGDGSEQGESSPTPVRVVESPDMSPLELFQMIIAPVVGPLGTTGLVLLLLIFMLLKRDDLRSRLIRLIGQGRISATTSAMDDAAARVTRYLLMQLVVNVTYGIPVAIGLYFIGVPNAILWGTFATVLRFIPYVGPWIAASFPVILSLAVSTGWTTPALTIGLFIVLELLSNNVMEPWLYGSSTGVSSLALIVAAVFWTYLWGPVGLVMATPITVCLAVMGHHIPRLAFLSILLSDERALTPAEDCYHRLLRPGGQDELELAEDYLKQHTLTDFHDSMLMPALIAGGRDQRIGHLSKDQIDQLEVAVEELILEINDRLPAIARLDRKAWEEFEAKRPVCLVCCVPAKAKRDWLGGRMLDQALHHLAFETTHGSARMITAERLNLVEESDADVVCISVVEPTTTAHARYLCMKMRAAFPMKKIMIGLWGTKTIDPEVEKSLINAGADIVVKGISQAAAALEKLALPLVIEMAKAPVPEDDQERIDALKSSGALETASDLKYFTDKLSRIFETPMAMLSLIDGRLQHFKAETGMPAPLSEAGQINRENSICGHVVANNEMMVVQDLKRDRRFANNPIVKEHNFRFYAGAPIRSAEGHAIGALCLIDTSPREFTQRERRLLNEYASDISDEILRKKNREISADHQQDDVSAEPTA